MSPISSLILRPLDQFLDRLADIPAQHAAHVGAPVEHVFRVERPVAECVAGLQAMDILDLAAAMEVLDDEIGEIFDADAGVEGTVSVIRVFAGAERRSGTEARVEEADRVGKRFREDHVGSRG